MIALLQRVTHASVTVNDIIICAINTGLLVLLGVEKHDSDQQSKRMAERILHYRVFDDDTGKMNLNVQEIAGSVLIVPQFTLAADTHKGNRPSFSSAAPPQAARDLYEACVHTAHLAYPNVVTGSFQSDMRVTLCNDGPVTFRLTT